MPLFVAGEERLPFLRIGDGKVPWCGAGVDSLGTVRALVSNSEVSLGESANVAWFGDKVEVANWVVPLGVVVCSESSVGEATSIGVLSGLDLELRKNQHRDMGIPKR